MKSNFLQSYQWLKFQQALGRKCWLLEHRSLKGLVISYSLPFRKTYFYCPYGPVIDNQDEQALIDFLAEVKKIALKEQAIFFRCDPVIGLNLEKFGFQKAPVDYFFSATAMPKTEAVLDISPDETAILNKMKAKTRYNIHLAEKKGIQIRQSHNLEDIDIFYELVSLTAMREHIRPHTKMHYQKLWESFGEKICLFFAFYQDKPIAAIMVLFFDKTATYLHGGFDVNYREVMAPHLLQWQAILEARKRGCLEYDFGGITMDSQLSWEGITRFKLSFGAEAVNYSGAFDLVFQPIWYKLYNLLRKFRRR